MQICLKNGFDSRMEDIQKFLTNDIDKIDGITHYVKVGLLNNITLTKKKQGLRALTLP